jgi:hypothetical protein
MSAQDHAMIRACFRFIGTKSSSQDAVRNGWGALSNGLERGITLDLLKQLKAKLIETFDALRVQYEQDPNDYSNRASFSPKVERELHEQLRDLREIMQKFGGSEEDLKFPERWFTGVQIRGGSTWTGPKFYECPMLMSSSRNIDTSLAQLKILSEALI